MAATRKLKTQVGNYTSSASSKSSSMHSNLPCNVEYSKSVSPFWIEYVISVTVVIVLLVKISTVCINMYVCLSCC